MNASSPNHHRATSPEAPIPGGGWVLRGTRVLRGRLRAAGVVTASAMLVAGFAAPAAAAPPVPGNVTQHTAGPWDLTGWRFVAAGGADQGVATVSIPGHRDRVVLRGNSDVSAGMRSAGWWHIGDPGSARGYLLDAYQAHSAKHAKLYVMTAPDGRRTSWVHKLVAGEKINNSFAAVAPSGRWFVSGEWGKMHRLLVFPMPGHNPLAKPGRNLPLVATIRLSHPVRNVQGCSFASPTRLICSTNDPYHDLYNTPQQLLSVSLSGPVDGRTLSGRPVELGPVPQLTGCGVAETEGIDVHRGRLLLVTRQPDSCGGQVAVFTYRLNVAPRSLPWEE